MKGGIAAMLLAVEAALAAGPAAGRHRLPERDRGGVRRERHPRRLYLRALGGRRRDRRADERRHRPRRRGRHLGADHDRRQSAARLRHGRGLPSDRDGGGRRRGPARSRGGAERRARAGVRRGGAPLPPERRRPACRRLAVDDPGRAQLDVRLGLPIRLDPAAGQERLAAAVRAAAPDAHVEFRGFRARGYAFEETPLVDLLCRCHEEVHGLRPRPEPSRATTDLRFFAPPLGPGQAVCYGPTGGGLHGVDEWVDLASIADVATVLALLLRRWGEPG